MNDQTNVMHAFPIIEAEYKKLIGEPIPIDSSFTKPIAYMQFKIMEKLDLAQLKYSEMEGLYGIVEIFITKEGVDRMQEIYPIKFFFRFKSGSKEYNKYAHIWNRINFQCKEKLKDGSVIFSFTSEAKRNAKKSPLKVNTTSLCQTETKVKASTIPKEKFYTWKYLFKKKKWNLKKQLKPIMKLMYMKQTCQYLKKCFGLGIEILNFNGSVNVIERDDMDWPLHVTIHNAEAFKNEMSLFFEKDNHKHLKQNLDFKIYEPSETVLRIAKKDRIANGCVLVQKKLWPTLVKNKLSLTYVLNP